MLTREPGGTPLAERIREVLLHARDVAIAPEAEALLFSAARAQLARDVVRPALDAGSIVIADRFYDSTLAYQGYARGADPTGLIFVTRFAVGDLMPDRTFLLDLPVDVCLARSASRRGERWDRFESGERDFHERVREGYLRLARAEPGRFVVIAGDRDENAIASDIWREVELLLGAAARRT